MSDGDNLSRITPEHIEQAHRNVVAREFRENIGYYRWFVNACLALFAATTLASGLCAIAVWKAQVEHQDPLSWVLATVETTAGFLVVFIVLRVLVRRKERNDSRP